MSSCRDQAWTRTRPAVAVRGLLLHCVFGTIIDSYARQHVSGEQHLTGIDGAAIVVANHCSHVDTPVLLRSFPSSVRSRTVVAAAADYFYSSTPLAVAVSLAFGTVPLERRTGNGRGLTETRIDGLIADGWTVVVFAEGTRSRDGKLGVLRPGAAVLAARHEVPIVPAHISGTHRAMPVGSNWMVRPGGRRLGRHAIRVTFGAPIGVRPDDEPREVMERVRLDLAVSGAETTGDPRRYRQRRAQHQIPG
jgi:1-acyl-sn-glycerol-3-phosphate acyltransferase